MLMQSRSPIEMKFDHLMGLGLEFAYNQILYSYLNRIN